MFDNRRGKGDSGPPKKETWQIVYTGLALILLCFFIMLSSFASVERSKMMRFTRSFTEALSILDGGLRLVKGKRATPPDSAPKDYKKSLDIFEKTLRSLPEVNRAQRQLAIVRKEGGLVMTLSDKLLFASGQARILKSANPLLSKIRELIGTVDFKVQIEGHTDNMPIRTTRFPSNWELSTARAVNVMRYFLKSDMILNNRLSAAGFAEFQPLVSNTSEGNRALNRRVEIVLRPVKPSENIQ